MATPPTEVKDPAIKLTASADPNAVEEWWKRWDQLPHAVRDRPASEVLAEQRATD